MQPRRTGNVRRSAFGSQTRRIIRGVNSRAKFGPGKTVYISKRAAAAVRAKLGFNIQTGWVKQVSVPGHGRPGKK